MFHYCSLNGAVDFAVGVLFLVLVVCDGGGRYLFSWFSVIVLGIRTKFCNHNGHVMYQDPAAIILSCRIAMMRSIF